LSQKKLKAGTRIDPNANETIQFVVSQNPTIVIPESLIGMDVNEAKESLNDQGIAVVLSGSGDTGVVVNVSPSVGSTYTQEGSDSVVTLYYQ
jgi:beta-lactam-binding protein with PASTA domain